MKWFSFFKRVDKFSYNDLTFSSIILAFLLSTYILIASVIAKIEQLIFDYRTLAETKGDELIDLSTLNSFLNEIASLILKSVPFAILTAVSLFLILVFLHLKIRKLAKRVVDLENELLPIE